MRLAPYYAGAAAVADRQRAGADGHFLAWSAPRKSRPRRLLAFTPIFFAGVVFAVSFTRAAEPDRAFGANIAGAMFGGLAEYSSMVLGFQYLLFVAVALYIVSIVGYQKVVIRRAGRGR